MVETLITALNRKSCVSFVYSDKFRIVEVHAVGDKHLRAFQVNDEVGWRLFTIDKIQGLAISPITSHAPRPGYKMNDSALPVIRAQVDA